MRKTALAGLAALALGGAGADLIVRAALAEPTPGNQIAAAPAGPAGMQHHGWMEWQHRWKRHQAERLQMMSLFYHPADRALTADDVQKIAAAFLLWNGNHTWKVGDVTENPDQTVSFAYTAADGTPIAKFSINRKTGHFQRLG